ncbi:MAG: nucleoside phosphorylase [bacterium]|nr:nucleoside phosphorylase [bacterium]
MKKRISLLISFLLGVGSYALYQNLFTPCHPFPNIKNKYNYPALLTAKMEWEKHKAIGKPLPIGEPPKTLILCYDETFLKDVLQKYPTEQCSVGIYRFNDYPSIAIGYFGLFGPTNAFKLERAMAWGIKQVIAIGSSAGLQKDIVPGDIIVCEKSLRDEGTSHHYLPYSKFVYPSEILQKKVLHYLQIRNIAYRLGPSWTTDAFYRTTKEEVEQYQKEGILTVEGEIAALFAVSAYNNIDAVALLTITDSFANLKWEKSTMYKEKKRETLYTLLTIALKVGTEKE